MRGARGRSAFALAAAALALASLAPKRAAAQPPGGGGPRRPPIDQVLERHAERLGLDDATRARIREIADAARSEAEPREQELRRLHEDMRALLEQESPELDAVMRQAERIGTAETELQKQRLRTLLAIRALLTPEQRAELVRIHEERRKEREQRGDPAAGPPP
jgi:Spy/CpxP family protein refolding chaperone